ncbi:MAG: hypothetical protein DRN25_07110 [Thermoplasmata archaeon]|nr:MAG: hypothetical protein DRN25_07110 [Thermoplasmata archaeon]
MRGQITIEAILIFGIFLLIIFSVSMPLAMKAKRQSLEVSTVADARYAAEQIVSLANSITFPGDKRTAEVYIPGDKGRGINTSMNIVGGKYLITTVYFEEDSPAVINLSLDGNNWMLWSDGNIGVFEDEGHRYRVEVSWGNITCTRL